MLNFDWRFNLKYFDLKQLFQFKKKILMEKKYE